MNNKEIFNHIMDNFNRKNIEYVILHAYHELPKQFDSDIDISINLSNVKEAIKLLDNILKDTGWRIIQYWRHEYYAVDCVISNDKEFLQVDFCIHYERNGRIFMDAKELVSDRRIYNNFYVPAPHVEFTYILIKKILKKNFSDVSKKSLVNLLLEADDYKQNAIKNSLKRFLNDISVEKVLLCIMENRFEDVDLEYLRMELRKNMWSIKENLKYAFFDIMRKVERIIHPTGLFIVLLGVDGAGKSTISNELKKRYATAFRRIKHYHSRVRVLKDISQIKSSSNPIDYSDPHSKKNSAGKLVSLIKFLYYYMDYMIGNVSIVKSKIQSSLVLIERYYFDYYIDRVRYNLNLPTSFFKLFEKFIKKPDATFILTGDSQTLLERKYEISIEEIEEQKKKFEDNFLGKKNVYFIDTTELSVDACNDLILKICNDIMRGRRKW